MEFGKRRDTADTTDFYPCQLVIDLLRTSYGETGVVDAGVDSVVKCHRCYRSHAAADAADISV